MDVEAGFFSAKPRGFSSFDDPGRVFRLLSVFDWPPPLATIPISRSLF